MALFELPSSKSKLSQITNLRFLFEELLSLEWLCMFSMVSVFTEHFLPIEPDDKDRIGSIHWQWIVDGLELARPSIKLVQLEDLDFKRSTKNSP